MTLSCLPVSVGARGRTRTINLDNKFRDDFEAGQTDEFLIEATPVGEVFAVQVSESESKLKSENESGSETET